MKAPQQERALWLMALAAALGIGFWIGRSGGESKGSGSADVPTATHSRPLHALPGHSNALANSSDPQVHRLASEIDLRSSTTGHASEFFRMRDSFARLAAIDPEAAVAKAEEIPNELKRLSLLREIFAVWAETDPDAALRYIDRHPPTEGIFYDRRVAGLVMGLAASDPARAFQVAVERNSTNSERYRLYDALFMAMADNGQMSIAAAHLAELPGDHIDQHTAYRSFGWSWAQVDAEATADWIARQSNDNAAESASGGLLKFWPEHDPAGAATFALEQRQGGYRLENVISRWAKNDIRAASEWLLERDPSPQLDAAVEELATQTMKFDPDAALGWAESITNKETRANLLRRIEAKRAELGTQAPVGSNTTDQRLRLSDFAWLVDEEPGFDPGTPNASHGDGNGIISGFQAH